MSSNPYQSSVVDADVTVEETELRRRARVHLRFVFLILLMPAIYNYVQFDRAYIADGGLGAATETMYRSVNLIGMALFAVLIWRATLPLLERIADFVRRSFAGNADRASWNSPLYAAIKSAVFLAIPGSILWFIWIVGFYELGLNFTVISYTVGIPGHVIGACFYVPLVYRWYMLTQAQTPSAS
jgi:hypothetical protein